VNDPKNEKKDGLISNWLNRSDKDIKKRQLEKDIKYFEQLKKIIKLQSKP